MPYKKITLWFAFLILNVSVYSADVPPDNNSLVKLEDYLTYAACNNAELKAAFQAFIASSQQIPQASSLPDPILNYEIDTKMGPKMQSVSVMQVFPWFGTLKTRSNEASASANAAYKNYESVRLKLFYDVKQAFYEYVYLSASVDIAKENLALAQHFREVASARYQVSAASNPDVIRAQIEAARLEYALESLQQYRSPITARLNSVLNRPGSAALAWPKKPGFHLVNLDKDRLLQLLKINNPQLASLDFQIQSAQSAVELAGKKFYPDIGVGVKNQRGLVSREGKDNFLMMMFSINLPIWRDNYNAAKLQAKAQTEQVKQEKINTENNIASEVSQALYDFEDSTRRIRLYGDNLIPQAVELISSSEAAYKAGSVDFLYLLDTQMMLLEYRLTYERALADNAQRLAQLEMLTGSVLADPNVFSEKLFKE
jgi:outer membrane protein TolC